MSDESFREASSRESPRRILFSINPLRFRSCHGQELSLSSLPVRLTDLWFSCGGPGRGHAAAGGSPQPHSEVRVARARHFCNHPAGRRQLQPRVRRWLRGARTPAAIQMAGPPSRPLRRFATTRPPHQPTLRKPSRSDRSPTNPLAGSAIGLRSRSHRTCPPNGFVVQLREAARGVSPARPRARDTSAAYHNVVGPRAVSRHQRSGGLSSAATTS
jgi:hypothetical protein